MYKTIAPEFGDVETILRMNDSLKKRSTAVKIVCAAKITSSATTFLRNSYYVIKTH